MVAGEVVRSGFVLDILKVKSTRCHLRLEISVLVSITAIMKHHTLSGFKQHKLAIF